MAVTAQEFHLCQALLLHGEAVIALVQQGDGAVDAGQAVVQADPHVVDVPVGGKDTLLDFELVEHITVAGAVAALVSVIGAHVEVPHGEGGVDILGRSEDGVGGHHHAFRIGGVFHLLVAQRGLGNLFGQDLVAGKDDAAGQAHI